MPTGLQKQNVNVNFAQGVDTKTDPFQLQLGKFLRLQNTVFSTGNSMLKRNGYRQLPSIDANPSTSLVTYNDSLLAISQSLNVLSASANQWFDKGTIQPVSVGTVPVARTSTSLTACDVAIASNGMACAVYLDSGTTESAYQIVESTTGQIVVPSVALPSSAVMARVFTLGSYFIITFLLTITAATHLQYIAIPINDPTNPGSPANLSSVVDSLSAGYDGVVANGKLYLAYDASDLGDAVRMTNISTSLQQANTVVLSGEKADLLSLSADNSGPTPVIWITYWDTSSNDAFTAARSANMLELLAPTQILNNVDLIRITSSAREELVTVFYEVDSEYSYASVASDYIGSVDCTEAGVVGTPAVIARSVGLASKSVYFEDNDRHYMLAAYGGAYQPTYFLIDDSGNVVAKLAYSNGGGYPVNQILPSVNLDDDEMKIGYLFKDFLAAVNKSQASATPGIYTQTGINVATLTLNSPKMIPAEIGQDLHLTGGFLWMYDGDKPVEHNFHIWPEDIEATGSNAAGSMSEQQYYYQVTYEWTDAQGNIHRSAPSIPVGCLLNGGKDTVTLDIPTLRLTYKESPNDVRIVIYRWSASQQNYYQITSITDPLLNDPSIDSVEYTDLVADSAIIGNALIYTTGGVIENIAAPSCIDTAIFKSRLFLIDSENRNLLWYSKQVIQSVPVEFSDLFTIYLTPAITDQGFGPNSAIATLDDKLIVFKPNACSYVVGTGPDNTGANNDFSEPVFITSTVGCENPQSIVSTPMGLMFQSNKGIWLLGRDLSTKYIGADVEIYNSSRVLSSILVPNTNQVRFTLDNGITLMYDYYYNQWGTFNGIPGIESEIYQDLHTYVNALGQVFQETPGSYLDASNPVLWGFQTGWINLAGLQGYQRAYFFYLLGKFLSPHKLAIDISYDYKSGSTQRVIVTPDNYTPPYGDADGPYGSESPYGGNSNVEQWRIFFETQKCEAFQLTIQEIFDPSYGVPAGAGCTLSGLNLVVGIKKGYAALRPSRSAG